MWGEASGVVAEETGAKAEIVAKETVVGAAVLPEAEEAEAQPLSSPSVPVPVMGVLEVGEVVEEGLMGAVDGVLIGAEEEVSMGVVVDVVVVVAAEVGEDEAASIKAQRPGGPVPTPNPQVEKTEKAIEAAVLAKKQKKPAEWPLRPGFGTQGRPVTLYANYFELQSVGKQLYRYHFEVSGDAAGKKPAGRKARHIVRLFIEEHLAQFRNSVVTDYVSTLIANQKILIEQEAAEYDVRYRDEYEDEYPEDPKVYGVRCQFTGTLNPSDLLSYLTSSDAAAMFASKADVIQAMNIILGYQPKSDPTIASVGANKHYAICGGREEKYSLGEGLEALRGFFVSVRAATSRLLVNVQVKYVACYQEGPLAHIFAYYEPFRPREIHKLRQFIRTLRVQVTHIKRTNKKGQAIPRIKGIAGVASPGDGTSQPMPPKVPRLGAGPKDVEFFLEAPGQQPSASQQTPRSKKGKKPAKAGPQPAGRYISVADFFLQNYNIQCDPKMPVVNVGTRENPSYLPVEVCEVVPGQQANAKLTPSQTRNMLNFAVRSPPHNAQSIVAQGTDVLGLGASPNPTLVDFGIQNDPRLITVPGRVLPAPSVLYRDESKPKQKPIKPFSGSWNMRSIRFSTSTNLPSWTWLALAYDNARYPAIRPEDLSANLKGFTDKLNEIGVIASPPRTGTTALLTKGHEDDNREKNTKIIDEAVAGLIEKHKPMLILTVLPSNDADIYNIVKRACDLTYGVRNVNVVADKFKKPHNDQYWANVGLKFNLKLGGNNQLIDPKELGLIGQNKTMLVGVDVTHPSPGSSSAAPSVAGMVASIDSTLGQWPAELRIQKSRQEMVAELDTMLKAHLRRWVRNRKNYPENIIVYRDGVSEGQYELVVQQELPLLKEACKEVYPASDTSKGLPRISIVIVGKRHHTRFYPTKLEDADKFGNPENGTVVDRGVTEARNWEFYLQAHTALKGTARPAHYFTVWDEVFCREKAMPPYQNAADILEGLTHRLCYLFGRATKAVSICPPAYYADLVCTRARCYLSKVFDETPTGSVVTGTDPGSMARELLNVKVHPNVCDTMFYI
ncbi:hypothetical protein AbraIFM66951_007099 [Aspergillus brasiliensis]|uniref:Piwi domain-containing protein n=1 Tax=Aspergillus brasiliensis TaxID=319629 RepID=A0A9W6DSB3_9EURO|nr:hypothetical protein AbraCBS73388_001285 [Aspergillus brasiliensis]GKZ44790.1 hypothetical protein AbraIFM66951_007099 [Aspergillus brasiliensis]